MSAGSWRCGTKAEEVQIGQLDIWGCESRGSSDTLKKTFILGKGGVSRTFIIITTVCFIPFYVLSTLCTSFHVILTPLQVDVVIPERL